MGAGANDATGEGVRGGVPEDAGVVGENGPPRAATAYTEILLRDGRVAIPGIGIVSIGWSAGRPCGLQIMPTNAMLARIRAIK